jgi:predicted DNA-binding protein
MSGYSNISIPLGLRKEVEKLIEDLKEEGIDLGYKTVAEFVKEAIRHRVEELRQIYFLGEKR